MSAKDNDMILLFGMPRSGTTWIGKTFDSHPGVSYRHEPDSQFRLDSFLPLLAERDAQHDQLVALDTYCRDMLPRCSPRCCGKQPHFSKRAQSALGRQWQQGFILVAKVAEKILGRAVSWPSRPQGRLTWKSIESTGRLGVMLQHYPNSRGVLILRDPRGYAASVLRGEAQRRFLSGDAIANDNQLFKLLCDTAYGRQCGITLDKIQTLAPEKRLAWLWVLFNQKALDDIQDLPNGTVVRYEDLCAEPADGFHALFDFCGLDWHPQTQTFVGASTRDEQARDDYYSVYKSPLVSANKWRQELTPEQITAIDEVISEHPAGRLYLDDTTVQATTTAP